MWSSTTQAAQRQAADRADRPDREDDLPDDRHLGNDEPEPNGEHVNKTEEVLKKLGKNYEFHRYDGCGHAFFNTMRVSHRPEQALDGWSKVFAFLQKNLGGRRAALRRVG